MLTLSVSRVIYVTQLLTKITPVNIVLMSQVAKPIITVICLLRIQGRIPKKIQGRIPKIPGVLFQENINQFCPRIPHYARRSQNTNFRAWIHPPLKVSSSTVPRIYIHSSLIFVITGFLRTLISSGVIRLRETLLSWNYPKMVF